MMTDLQVALDRMSLPILMIRGVAGLLVALESTDNPIEPAHLMPLSEALEDAINEVKEAYETALREVQEPPAT